MKALRKNSLKFLVQKSWVFRSIIVCLLAILIVGSLQGSQIFAETVTPTATQTPTPTPDTSQKKNELQDKIKEYESKISELQSESKTLSSQIKLVDNQIAVSELRVQETKDKISKLEKDIEVAKDKINNLESNIERVSKIMVERVSAVYAVGTIDPLQMLLTSNNIENFLTRLKYLQIVQLYDKRQIYAAEQSKNNYEQEKSLFEEKQKEAEVLGAKLEDYNKQLASEKAKKKNLLDVTQNDEKKYQQLLANARAEYESIQGIIAGRGVETEAGKVNEGERIASIIQGASCNSSGTHLHFIVKEGGTSRNPFNYLSSIDHVNNSGGDSFNPSGSWKWPIDPTIQYNQGYGVTWAIQNSWVGNAYKFHDGIDIGSTGSQTVRAVKSGTLYQGSYSGTGGCRLRYVRVKHDEGGAETLYLHINY